MAYQFTPEGFEQEEIAILLSNNCMAFRDGFIFSVQRATIHAKI